ncbi:hypothetical protein BG846_02365 [Streptomyces fradiae ATCC 10745 = DSM 40063]|uniref:Uncharacterized protein n=1 Tax=Streptomyces fradiae ATCC 10745 = DSM 40063 TaxID=1319510 RepID=A0A1Y2NXQ2_STRFR|nr:hypothetical protein BG846_02365 [Streptomyces fradiae ATCC 10745 = DSM 40063]
MCGRGSPSGRKVPTDSTRWAAAQIVASVGPYRFHRARAGSCSRSAVAGDRASPPERTVSEACGVQPVPSSRRHRLGVAWATETRLASSASRYGSAAVSREARTTVAPTVSGRSSSSREMSKATVVWARTVSSAVTPRRPPMPVRKSASAPWPISTPFGSPVEPLVKRVYARSAAVTRGGTAWAAPSGSGTRRAGPRDAPRSWVRASVRMSSQSETSTYRRSRSTG